MILTESLSIIIYIEQPKNVHVCNYSLVRETNQHINYLPEHGIVLLCLLYLSLIETSILHSAFHVSEKFT